MLRGPAAGVLGGWGLGSEAQRDPRKRRREHPHSRTGARGTGPRAACGAPCGKRAARADIFHRCSAPLRRRRVLPCHSARPLQFSPRRNLSERRFRGGRRSAALRCAVGLWLIFHVLVRSAKKRRRAGRVPRQQENPTSSTDPATSTFVPFVGQAWGQGGGVGERGLEIRRRGGGCVHCLRTTEGYPIAKSNRFQQQGYYRRGSVACLWPFVVFSTYSCAAAIGNAFRPDQWETNGRPLFNQQKRKRQVKKG